MTRHRKACDHHLEKAQHCHHTAEQAARIDVDPLAALALAQAAALIAIAFAQRGQLAELTRIRHLLEAQPHHDNRTLHFNSVVTLVSKDGGNPMPLPPFNPSDTQDVAIAITPTNRNGDPTTGPFVWSSNTTQLTPQPAADGKTVLVVTGVGAIDGIITVTDNASGNTDTFQVTRTVAPPPDNLTTNFNPSGSLVDKAVPPTP